MRSWLKRGVTLLELIVVVVIVSILSTVAVGVFTKEISRAKYARARAEIRTLEVAIAQYEVDTGHLPPSGSGSNFAPSNITTTGLAAGSGYLQMSLRSSLNGFPNSPLSQRWLGPYIDWDYNRLGNLNGDSIMTSPGNTAALGEICFLDPWGGPYIFIRATDYATRGGTELSSTNPFFATETYYNPSTFQIISEGPTLDTLPAPSRGTQSDDVTNFRGPDL